MFSLPFFLRCISLRARLLRWGVLWLGLLLLLLWLAGQAEAAPLLQAGLTFVVNSTADPGSGGCDLMECTLREAIIAANANPGLDSIHFAIPGAGPHTITPVFSGLPVITSPVIIDGYTQAGASANTLADGDNAVLKIELNGSGAGAGAHGLEISAGGSSVRGLVINRFSETGIVIRTGSGSVVAGNFIGVDVTGALDRGNGYDGVAVIDSADNVIGGSLPISRNVIAGNANVGVAILNGGATDNRVDGNFIGVGVSGATAITNTTGGVLLSAEVGQTSYAMSNTIGGPASGAGNVISGNGGYGVQVFRGDHNQIQGNIIGLSSTGAAMVRNATYGVLIQDASHTLIGGTASSAGNIIAGNGDDGVQIYASARDAANNRVQGNVIGADATLTFLAGNRGDGVAIITNAIGAGRAISNTVGGMDSSDGLLDGVTAAANVILANIDNGVALIGPRTSANRVSGNHIGSDGKGGGVSNGKNGVLISNIGNTTAAFDNLIGGDETGAGNVISLNSRDGVQIGFGATGNRVVRNLIGVRPDRRSAMGNGRYGVAIFDSPGNIIGTGAADGSNFIAGNQSHGVYIGTGALGGGATGNQVLGNEIGSYDLFSEQIVKIGNGGGGVLIQNGAGNLLDGNVIASNAENGVVISGTHATGNQLVNNSIGVDRGAYRHLANALDGVLINDAPGNFVGEDAAGGNVIAGNGQNGVHIVGANAAGNEVQHNQIGGMVGHESLGGVALLGNDGDGVALEQGAHDNLIGGATANAGNQLVGNKNYGLLIFSATSNQVQGNFIGVALDGVTAMPNETGGVLVSSAMSNTFGGTTAGAGNVVSANSEFGVQIQAGSTGNRLLGNRIGANATGDAALGNDGPGVAIIDSSSNIIGGSAAGSGNLISANAGDGVRLSIGSTNNQILGNLIGTNAAGAAALGNGRHGVVLIDAPNNIVGGSAAGSRNLVSGNKSYGVVIASTDGASGGNQVQGNFIGVDVSGSAALSNTLSGILISDSPTNTIGGLVAGAGNLISGNGLNGVHVFGDGAHGNRVLGNIIGANQNGAMALPNAFSGVVIEGAANNRIGDPDIGGRNQISGNGRHGVHILGVDAVGNRVQDNFIGVDFSGLEFLGNGQHGVLIEDGGNNLIGDTDPLGLGGNDIAFNGADLGLSGHGVMVKSGAGNTVRKNRIQVNAGRGIDLGGDSFTVNDLRDGDGGANNLQNFPVVVGVRFGPTQKSIQWFLSGPATTAYAVDVYANEQADPSGFGEGRNWLMAITATTNISGFVFFTTTHPLTDLFIAATATGPDGSTSEFSPVDTDGDALADAWETTGVDVNEDGVIDLSLAGQAKPNHKDLFVEIDSMTGRAPQQAALDMVTTAFAQAPANLVQNPDGAPGVNLHLNPGGDNSILLQDWNLLDANGWPTEFDAAKTTTFGLPIERGDANWPQIRQARTLVYRYNIWADTYNGTSISGIAELAGDGNELWGGNDFIVTLGAWQDAAGTPGGTIEDQTGTLMHELGHTLGLRHGGGDHIQFKPNYHSIMNYTWQTPASWMVEDANGDGVLDARKTDIKTIGVLTDSLWAPVYSERLFNTLNEASLDEAAGIGGHGNHWVRVGQNIAGGITSNQPETGAIDWNSDGDTLDIVADSTINDGVGGVAPTQETLLPHEDWSKLRLYFVETVDFQDGMHASVETNEMNLDIKHRLDSLGEGPGFLHFSHLFYAVDEAAISVTIQVVRSAGTDGAVTVDYTTLDGTAQEALDYEMTTGVLTFAPGEYLKTITIPIVADVFAEADEQFPLILSNPTGGARLKAPNTATVRIADDDSSPLVVVNTNDSGPGSLRQAILDANANAAADIIQFDIPGRGVHTIQPLTPLPNVTGQTIIDGYTQPGARPNTAQQGTNAVLLIELNGISAGRAPMFSLRASNSKIMGVVINRTGQFNINTIGAPAIEAIDATNLVVAGNFIGTDSTGMTARSNFGEAIRFLRVHFSTIGGYTRWARNLLSGNANGGVQVGGTSNVPAIGNAVLGNLIGVAADGVSPMGNRDDVGNGFSGADGYGVLLGYSNGARVGDPALEAANVIAYNVGHGVAVHLAGSGNTIRANAIFSNAHMGITLNPVGYLSNEWYKTPNDPNDADDGRNRLQNFPVLTSVVSADSHVVISGVLNSTPGSYFTLDFYASPTVDDSGFGEGKRYLGAHQVMTDENGDVQFNVNFPLNLPQGEIVTATATDAGGNTSEFSERLAVGETLTSTLVVNSNNDVDDGTCNLTHCSLREAIHSANNHPGHDEIRFSIGSGVRTIAPATSLPLFSDPFTLDGSTQPGFAGTPIIELQGDGVIDMGLWLFTYSSTVRSLVINRFQLNGIGVFGTISTTPLPFDGGGHVIQGNYIGTDVTGTLGLGNGRGIGVSSPHNLIGGASAAERNLISGNDGSGIEISSGDNNMIRGNYIGTNAAGTTAIGNSRPPVNSGPAAVRIYQATGAIIGGPLAGMGNLISGNRNHGIEANNTTLIQGNIIGLNAAGTGALGNGGSGISGGGMIGGSSPSERNVIAANQIGVSVGGNAVVQGNYIGTDITGLLDRGNTSYGIWVQGQGNLIGGVGAGQGNIIAGNGRSGALLSSGTSGNVIQGNLIGLAADGATVLRNDQNGVLIAVNANGDPGTSGPSNNLVGGAEPGAANRIVGNGQAGVRIKAGVNNRILSNIIDGNTSLGIDLHPDGVTANDAGDGDSGANLLQNFPLLTIVSNLGGQTAVVGTLNSAPNQAYTVQFFANATCDASGNGEGQTYLGERSVTTDGSGNATIGAIFPFALPNGHFVTAAATDPNGNTSEFSACRQASATPLADVAIMKSAVTTIPIGSPLTYTVRLANSGNVTATGVVFTDTAPLPLRLAVAAPGCSQTGNRVVCAVGSLGVGQGMTITLVATSTTAGSITNVVTVTSASDIDALNNVASVTTLVVNAAPVADAGVDQSVGVGQPVMLDGGGSFDPDSHALSFGWTQVGGTPVVLSSSSAVSPTFTAPASAGALTFSLIVTDAFSLASAPDTVAVTVTNRAPVADAGADKTVGVGQPVMLDGSASFDPDGHVLTFGWTQVGGTPVVLSSSSAVSPTFTAPGNAGVLTFTMTVTDSFGLVSVADAVAITVTNRAPVANAGPDRTVGVSQPVTLDGSGSFDPDGHALSFGWVQSGGPAVSLSSSSAVSPTFTAPGNAGVLTFTLAVTDSFGLVGAPDAVVVTVTNRAPVANAGADQTVGVGQPVTLDGSASFDPDGHTLTFGWVQSGGAPVVLSSASAVSPTFAAPGSVGVMIFTLAVTDSFGLVSAADTVVVTVTNRAPVANAGMDRTVIVGRMTQLDSSASFDPDGHAFTRGWRQTGGAALTLFSATAVSPTLTPLTTGVFSFTLDVTDAFGLAGATDSVIVASTNRAPVAVVGDDQVVSPGAAVTLDGSASFDPDQHTIEFVWVQVSGDLVTLSNPDDAQPTFTAPLTAQTLEFELIVTDAFGLADLPERTSIEVQSPASFNLYLPVIQANR